MKKDNIIQNKSFQFSLKIIDFYKKMVAEKEYILSKQLLKSGTSIGANVEEAIAAQSRKDFINKLSIASKEARETKYWLRLLKHSELISLPLDSLISDINDIINILTKIIISTKNTI